MDVDRHGIEASMARFDAAVAMTVGQLAPGTAPVVQHNGTAVTIITPPAYPWQHVAGIVAAADFPQIVAQFPVQLAPFAMELAPVLHDSATQILFRAAGFQPAPTDVVWLFDTRRNTIPTAAANLVWTTAADAALPLDHIPADNDRILRHAYARQPDAISVSLLHPDGIIASAGIRLEGAVAYCFGGWIAPHRRVRGMAQSLLDARIRYAAECGCTTVVLVAPPLHAAARIALGRGFLHGWGRERWTSPAQLGRHI